MFSSAQGLWNFLITYIIAHKSGKLMPVCHVDDMVSFLLPCSSPSHPKTGWARATPRYLHRVHGSGLPPSQAALVPRAKGDSKERVHPHRDGLLPGLSGGLSDLPEPNAHQQRQLHPGGQQPSGDGHQDGVWSLPHGPWHRRRRWADHFCSLVILLCACGWWVMRCWQPAALMSP